MVEVHEQECVDRCKVAEAQIIAAGQSGAIGGRAALVRALQAQTKALVEHTARKLDLMPWRAAIAARGRPIEQIEHRNARTDQDFVLNTVAVVQSDVPAAWLATTTTKTAAAKAATATATGTWSTLRATGATGAARARRAAKGPAHWRSCADISGHVKAPTNTLGRFTVIIHRPLVHAH